MPRPSAPAGRSPKLGPRRGFYAWGPGNASSHSVADVDDSLDPFEMCLAIAFADIISPVDLGFPAIPAGTSRSFWGKSF